jgi:hypothetical protein
MNAVKIICDQCGAKHQIGAEKLQDIQKKETFKIRCKNCAQPIVVQTKTLFADQTSQPQANEAQKVEATNENAQWFAMIQDQQQGPFVLKQLRAKWAQSVIDQNTYVWREGLDGWQMISQLPELQAVWNPVRPTPAIQAKSIQAQANPIQANPIQAMQDDQPATKAFAQQASPFVQQASPFAQFAGTPKPEEPKLPASQTIGYGFDQQSELASDLYAQRSKNLNKNTMSLEQAQPVMQPQVQSFQMSQSFQVQPQAQSFQKPEDDDLLSSVKAPLLQSSEANQSSSSAEASFKLKNQRNENSVLFSLESIEGGKSDIKILNGNADREASGLIDLSSLGNDLNVVSKPTFQLPSNRTLITKQNQSFQTIAIVLVSLFSISGLVLGSLWIYNTYIQPPQKTENKIVFANANQTIQTPQTTQVTSVEKTSVADAQNTPSTDTAVQAQTNSEEKKKTEKPNIEVAEKKRVEKVAEKTVERVEKVEKTTEKVEPKKTTPPVVTSAKPATNVNDLLKNLRGGGGGTATPPPVIGSSNSNRGDLPEKLGKADVLGSIQPQIPNVKRCSDRDPSLTGTVKVKIQVANTGNVTGANVENDPFAGTPVGACVERVVKSIKFPQFSSPSMSFTFPFALP